MRRSKDRPTKPRQCTEKWTKNRLACLCVCSWKGGPTFRHVHWMDRTKRNRRCPSTPDRTVTKQRLAREDNHLLPSSIGAARSVGGGINHVKKAATRQPRLHVHTPQQPTRESKVHDSRATRQDRIACTVTWWRLEGEAAATNTHEDDDDSFSHKNKTNKSNKSNSRQPALDTQTQKLSTFDNQGSTRIQQPTTMKVFSFFAVVVVLFGFCIPTGDATEGLRGAATPITAADGAINQNTGALDTRDSSSLEDHTVASVVGRCDEW